MAKHALLSASSERIMSPWSLYFLPSIWSSEGNWFFPSISHFALNSGIRSTIQASSLAPVAPHMEKNISLPHTMRESSSLKTAMGRGKFIRVLLLAFSVS